MTDLMSTKSSNRKRKKKDWREGKKRKPVHNHSQLRTDYYEAGAKARHNRLSLHTRCLHLKWAPALIQAAPPLNQLPAGKAAELSQVLGPLLPCERPGRSSWL